MKNDFVSFSTQSIVETDKTNVNDNKMYIRLEIYSAYFGSHDTVDGDKLNFANVLV